MELTPESLADFIRAFYPDRDAPDAEAISALITDLRSSEISTLSELEEMLARTSDAFLSRERDAPPNGEEGSRFAAVGVVRVSLSLEESGTETNQTQAEPPSDEPQIAPLAVGEERLLQTVHRADGNRNDIYLAHRRPSDDPTMVTGEPLNFIAIIRYTDSKDSDDSDPLWAWKKGATERSVYIRVAEAFCNAPPIPGNSVELDPDVQWFVDRINEKYGPGPSEAEIMGKWIDIYATSCEGVVSKAHACLEAANRAVGARSMIAQHQYDGLPGTPMSIRTFTAHAERAEAEFAPLYDAFIEECAAAREAAAQLLGSDPLRAEIHLAMGLSEEVLDRVATAKGIMRASFGPTPSGFLDGVAMANAIMENAADGGNIFTPASE